MDFEDYLAKINKLPPTSSPLQRMQFRFSQHTVTSRMRLGEAYMKRFPLLHITGSSHKL